VGRHRPDRRAVKRYFSYTVEEAAHAVGVETGSVRRWMKTGLPYLDDQRPFLILGKDLREYLAARTKPKQRCKLNEFFCFHCRAPKPAGGSMIDYTARTIKSGQLSAICEACDTIMYKNFSASKLADLSQQAEVSFPQGDPHLNRDG
jgi:hypothetical protein